MVIQGGGPAKLVYNEKELKEICLKYTVFRSFVRVNLTGGRTDQVHGNSVSDQMLSRERQLYSTIMAHGAPP